MRMTVLSIKEFLSGYENGRYPEGFLADYELIECLAHNAQGETLLVRNKDGLLFVAKCYPKSAPFSNVRESTLLRGPWADQDFEQSIPFPDCSPRQ